MVLLSSLSTSDYYNRHSAAIYLIVFEIIQSTNKNKAIHTCTSNKILIGFWNLFRHSNLHYFLTLSAAKSFVNMRGEEFWLGNTILNAKIGSI